MPSETISTTDQEESKTSHKPSSHKPTKDYFVDSEEEDEAEQARMTKIAKKMNRNTSGANPEARDAEGKRRKK